MTDLVIFVGIVGVVVVLGILVGMIVAGRIDRLLAPRPPAPQDPGVPPAVTDPEDDAPASPVQEEHP